MKENLGQAVYTLRINKGMKQKELGNKKISIGQISNIESGIQMPSTEKFMTLLENLNVRYDEFIYSMNDEYLTSKLKLNKQLDEFIRKLNLGGLNKLEKEASTLYIKYDDPYFQHINLLALAAVQFIEGNNDYENAKQCLTPIKDYLNKITEWNHYELKLIASCLFMFDIEEAIVYGERALELIEKNNAFYIDEDIRYKLLFNLATYALDYESYYELAINYSKTAIDLAIAFNDTTRFLRANANYQIACFKQADERYSEQKLLAILKTFKSLEWHKSYEDLTKFIQKHGIVLKGNN